MIPKVRVSRELDKSFHAAHGHRLRFSIPKKRVLWPRGAYFGD